MLSDYGGGMFGRDDFARLADELEHILAQLVLAINDTPGARYLWPLHLQ